MFFEIVATDFLWVAASFMFVWAYMAFHLRSAFLSGCSMFNILMSFFLTLVLYRAIFRIEFFSFLHILAVFVVLGVAADDVFVYTDAFNQAREYKQLKGDLSKQIAYTQRRASKAIFVTSFTTAVAFLATGMSDLMPISSFGFFAAIIIPMNYVLVITAYPPILVIWHKYIRFRCCKFCEKQPKDKVNEGEDGEDKQGVQAVPPQEPHETDHQEDDKVRGDEKLSRVERCFSKKWNNWIYKTRYICVPVLIIWMAISIWRATLLEPLTEEE